jgi:hypothetical protein
MVQLVPVLLLVEFVLKSSGRVGLVPGLLSGTSPTLIQDFITNSTNSNTGTSSTMLQDFNTNSINSNTGTSSNKLQGFSSVTIS